MHKGVGGEMKWDADFRVLFITASINLPTRLKEKLAG